MNEPYTTFDTLTISHVPGVTDGLPMAGSLQAPTIVARLPRLGTNPSSLSSNTDPKTHTKRRIDQPETALHGSHLRQSKPSPQNSLDFTTTTTVSPPHRGEAMKPAHRRQPRRTMPTRADQLSREEILELDPENGLLRLEAAIMPYSRWIVLAAVIAALGLSLVLLRGTSPALRTDQLLPTPIADQAAPNQGLATTETSTPTVSKGPTHTGMIVSGPTGMPVTAQGKAPVPRAQLAGKILPVVARPTASEESAVLIDYPRTATATPLWNSNDNRSTRR